MITTTKILQMLSNDNKKVTSYKKSNAAQKIWRLFLCLATIIHFFLLIYPSYFFCWLQSKHHELKIKDKSLVRFKCVFLIFLWQAWLQIIGRGQPHEWNTYFQPMLKPRVQMLILKESKSLEEWCKEIKSSHFPPKKQIETYHYHQPHVAVGLLHTWSESWRDIHSCVPCFGQVNLVPSNLNTCLVHRHMAVDFLVSDFSLQGLSALRCHVIPTLAAYINIGSNLQHGIKWLLILQERLFTL